MINITILVGYEHLQNLLMKTALEAFPPHMPGMLSCAKHNESCD